MDKARLFFSVVACLAVLTACSQPSSPAGEHAFVKPLRHFANGFIPADTWTYLFDDLLRLDTKALYEPSGEGVQVAGVLVRQGENYVLYRDFAAAGRGGREHTIKVRVVPNQPEQVGTGLPEAMVGKIVVIVGYFHNGREGIGTIDAYSIRWSSIKTPDPKLLYPDPIIR